MAQEACCIAHQAPGVGGTAVDASLGPAQHRLHTQYAPQSLHHLTVRALEAAAKPRIPTAHRAALSCSAASHPNSRYVDVPSPGFQRLLLHVAPGAACCVTPPFACALTFAAACKSKHSKNRQAGHGK
jgi:hypothetical protein